MMDIELASIDAYVKWFKARGVTRLAVIGGFGERLYPLLAERYGDFMVKARHEPLHGAIILAQQNFGAQ
jgi:glucosamine kinase